MTDKDKEIVRTLKNHIEAEDCVTCESFGKCNEFLLTKDTLDLINRQKAEIERLKRENEILSVNADTAFQDGLNEARDLYATEVENEIKAEAVREFADKLKENITDCHTVSDGEYIGYDRTDITHCIDNLVKEMVVDAERHKLIFKR